MKNLYLGANCEPSHGSERIGKPARRLGLIKMQDMRGVVADYVGELSGPRADDACYSLLELGPAALPHLDEAFRMACDRQVRRRLAEVVCHIRSLEALSFLTELLNNRNPELWKIALDGLVMLGDDPAGRPRVVEVLAEAKRVAEPEKVEWIDEALGQVRPRIDD